KYYTTTQKDGKHWRGTLLFGGSWSGRELVRRGRGRGEANCVDRQGLHDGTEGINVFHGIDSSTPSRCGYGKRLCSLCGHICHHEPLVGGLATTHRTSQQRGRQLRCFEG